MASSTGKRNLFLALLLVCAGLAAFYWMFVRVTVIPLHKFPAEFVEQKLTAEEREILERESARQKTGSKSDP